jgi:hypothetical protein
MKSFDETYADQDFKQQMAQARSGWMSLVPQSAQPDLRVEGLHGGVFSRLLGLLGGRSRD